MTQLSEHLIGSRCCSDGDEPFGTCQRPATQLVREPDGGAYPMCEPCAEFHHELFKEDA